MRYQILTDDENGFLIQEKTTGLVVEEFVDQEEARWYCKFLNLGGAFDGWTPRFMLTKIDVDALENDAYSYK